MLNHLLTVSDFKSKNFDSNNITEIDEKTDLGILSTVNEEIIIFIVQPDRQIFDVIVKMHFMLRSIKPNSVENIVFIPGENHDIIEYMTENNVKNDFNIESLNFDLLPIDIDLLSLERDNCLKEIYIDNNYSSIDDLSNAVVKLETCFGKIKNKYVKGNLAETFCKIVKEKEIENDLNTKEEILGMVVLDRSVDFMTLMATNYTCEGLIDDNFGIYLGKIKVKENIVKENLNKNQVLSDKLLSYGLTTKINPFYCRFRCMHYIDGIKFINYVRDYYQKLAGESKDAKKKLTITQLREFTEELNYYMTKIKDSLIMNENILNNSVEPLKNPNYLKVIEIEQLMLAGDLPNNLYKYYDEHLCQQRDLISLIKLMILESLTQNGVKDYQRLKREIMNIYGYQKIFLFRDLENLGWLKEKQLLKSLKKNITEITYSQVCEKLELVKINYNQTKVDDCSFVLGGFCPLSLRIIETAIEGKWHKIIDTLKKMPGHTSLPNDETEISNPTKDNNIIFIVFVGGVTYAEIEGIRFLNRKFKEEYINKKRKKKTQFIILTTAILSCKKIFKILDKDDHSSLTMKQFFEDNEK